MKRTKLTKEQSKKILCRLVDINADLQNIVLHLHQTTGKKDLWFHALELQFVSNNIENLIRKNK